MAEKSEKTKKSVKPAEKKMVQNILLKHPEVINNARHLFRNENGRTIVEDRVPRGDPDRKTVGQPFCQGDLTDTDLRDLAKYATEIIDEGILRYDEKTAHEDALHRAIDQKDGGKYAGKVGAVTYNLLLGHVGKGKKSSTEKKASESLDVKGKESIDPATLQSEIKKEEKRLADKSEAIKTQEKLLGGKKITSLESSKEAEEAPMSNLGELAKVAQFIASQNPEQRLILKAMIKEAADQNDPKRWQKTMDSIGITATKSKNASEEDENPGEDDAIKAEEAKKHDEDEKDHEKKEKAEEKKIEEKAVEEAKDEKAEKKEKADKKEEEEAKDKDATSIVNQLDSIAGELEQSGDFDLFKVAYQLDQVADVLEGKKNATALESEPDEKYMKDAFNSTIRQKDKDEKYMESFATDKTQEVITAYTKRPYGIVK
jgi:hypothetical protein